MSYVNSNFYENPEYYKGADIGEPVPGWGLNPAPYAHSRVGVGALPVNRVSSAAAAISRTGAYRTGEISAPIDEPSDIAWYYWVGGSALLVGIAGFVYYKWL